MHIPTNGILIAIVAHGLIGISLLWDKILLEQPATKDLANYVFWLGGMSVFGVLLIPFGFHLPSMAMIGLAVCAGVIHLAANWFYYGALKMGEASETLAVMGGFAPLVTALIAMPLLSRAIGNTSVFAFGLMVAGGFVMFFTEKVNWRKVLPSVVLAAGLFGLTNVLQKIVFNTTGFVTGYVFFTIGTFLGAMALLLRPLWREQIFKHSEEAPPKSKLWYFVNRFISGVGSFLIFLAISHAHPAVVSAIAGVRYSIIFLGAYLLTKIKPDWLHEDFEGKVLIGKSVATGMIVAGLVMVGVSGRETGGGGGAARLYIPARAFSSSPHFSGVEPESSRKSL